MRVGLPRREWLPTIDRLFFALALLAIAALAPVPAPAQVAPVTEVAGTVFADLDANGERDPEEPGMGGVRVSNGIEVLASAEDGTFVTTVTRDDSRFVLLTVPRGYRATRGYYHRVGPEAADSVAFGLAVDPAADRDHFRFVHASDPHVFDAAGAVDFGLALGEIAALDPPVDFVVITGDLVSTGNTVQLGHAASALVAPPILVHPGFGDHDANPDSLRVRNFEALIGPTYYSFDRGPYHFILYNDVYTASLATPFCQLTWLQNDIAATPADRQILVFTHYQPDRREMDLYHGLGVDAVLSGHWHAHRTTTIDGILNLNTGTLRMAGIDRTSRGFRVIDLDGGAVTSERRTSGIAPRLTIVDPPAGTVPQGEVKIRAMGYATSDPNPAARFTVTGPDGVVASGDLVAEGGWSYTGTWDAGGIGPGTYDLVVELSAQRGVLARSQRWLLLEQLAPRMAPPHSGAPVSQLRGDLGGSGRVEANLTLPLRVAWSRHVGGPTELSSPVIDNGRVFIAFGSAVDPGPVGVVAFDIWTGAELWRHVTAAEVKGTPAVAGGKVFLSTSVGMVEALAADSGALVWATALGDPANRWDVTSPLVDGGVVYAGGPAVTAALDAETGAILWERNLGSDWVATIYSAPIGDANHLILGLNSGLFVLDRATGSTVWSRSTDELETHRGPALVDGVLYAAGDTFGSQRLRALDAASGAELWSAPFTIGNSNSEPAVGDSAVVIGSGYGTLEAFARSDGHALWSFAVGEAIASGRPYSGTVATVTSSPILAGNEAYFGADDGKVYAVDVATGSERWSIDLGAPVRSSPAAAGGFLVISTADGTLFTLFGGEPTPAGIETGSAGAPAFRATLGPVSPNPFLPSGVIPITIAGASPGGGAGSATVAAELDVIDVLGRRVRSLLLGPLAPGRHTLRWDTRDSSGKEVASGVYFLRLKAGSQLVTTRLTLVR